jgi:hypothetical protein
MLPFATTCELPHLAAAKPSSGTTVQSISERASELSTNWTMAKAGSTRVQKGSDEYVQRTAAKYSGSC